MRNLSVRTVQQCTALRLGLFIIPRCIYQVKMPIEEGAKMYYTELEMKQTLEAGDKILLDKPELNEMLPEDVLDSLNDGTQEMIHNRWAVAARVYVNGIQDFSYEKLVERLAQSDISEFLCIYIFFILQEEYGISVVKMLIEAKRQSLIERIIPYVYGNLEYEKKIDTDEIVVFLETLNLVSLNKKIYLMKDYAKLIVKDSQQELVFQVITQDSNHVDSEFMQFLVCEVYKKDYKQANQMIETLLSGKESAEKFWVAITEGLYSSLYFELDFFEEQYKKFSEYVKDRTIWIRNIKSLVLYITKSSGRVGVRCEVMSELKTVCGGDAEEKSEFLNSISRIEVLDEELLNIRDSIFACSFKKDAIVLGAIKDYFVITRDKWSEPDIFETLRCIFIVNEYDMSNYKQFFDGLDWVWNELEKEQKTAWEKFIESMFCQGIHQFVFAIGLYEYVLNVSELANVLQNHKISIEQASIIIGILTYWLPNGEKISHMGFEMAKLVHSDDNEEYMDVFLEEIYGNFCDSSRKMAEKYLKSQNNLQMRLVNEVTERHNKKRTVQEKARKVPDFQPSVERSRIYQIVRNEQNKKINKLAHQKSVFMNIFPTRVMKYGKRNAVVQNMGRGEQAYATSPYVVTEYAFELPVLYTQHPAEWHNRKLMYLQKRSDYIASNH